MNMIRKMQLVIIWPVLLIANACIDNPPDIVPTFSVNHNPVYALDTLRIVNETEGFEEFLWLFGDGAYSTEENPIHIYTTAGEYTITLEAQKNDDYEQVSMQITVLPPFEAWIDPYVLDGSLNDAMSIDAGDLDDDGDLDILIASENTNEIVLYENNNDSWIKHIVDSESSTTQFAYIGDITNDGEMNFVGYSHETFNFYLYSKNGTNWDKSILWTPESPIPHYFHFQLHDINQDGKLDIVTAGDRIQRAPLEWYENQYPNWIKHTISSTVTSYSNVAIADVDSDGLPDIITSQQPLSRVQWYKNENSGESWVEGTVGLGLLNAWTASTGDFNNDGQEDVVVVTGGPYTWGGGVYLYENVNLNWFRHNINTQLDGANHAVITDLDNDGISEIIATGYKTNEVIIYSFNEEGIWEEEVFSVIDSPKYIKVIDLNSDNLLDIIVAGSTEAYIHMQQEKYPDQ